MKYKVGDKVRIVSKWGKGCYQDPKGKMDKWLGTVMTVNYVGEILYRMVEDSEYWGWTENCIEGLACENKIVITTIKGDSKMKINDKVTIIDYNECKLYYFNEDVNRNKLKLHCYIDKKDWNVSQATNSLAISNDGSFNTIDSFGLWPNDTDPKCYRLWFYKKFVRSTDITNLKVGDFIRVKPFKDVPDTIGINISLWETLYSKPLKIIEITTSRNYRVQYLYDDASVSDYFISSEAVRYVCTEEEVDTFVAKYASAKTCKDFVERCKRIIKINPELKTVIESKIPMITTDTHYSVDESNTRIGLFCESILAYNNTMNLKDFLEKTRSIIDELDK